MTNSNGHRLDRLEQLLTEASAPREPTFWISTGDGMVSHEGQTLTEDEFGAAHPDADTFTLRIDRMGTEDTDL